MIQITGYTSLLTQTYLCNFQICSFIGRSDTRLIPTIFDKMLRNEKYTGCVLLQKTISVGASKIKTMVSWISISTPAPIKPSFRMQCLKKLNKRSYSAQIIQKMHSPCRCPFECPFYSQKVRKCLLQVSSTMVFSCCKKSHESLIKLLINDVKINRNYFSISSSTFSEHLCYNKIKIAAEFPA